MSLWVSFVEGGQPSASLFPAFLEWRRRGLHEQTDLQSRIQRLETSRRCAIEVPLCHLCDDSCGADRLAPLFTTDAIWDGGVLGRFVGREVIRLLQQCSKSSRSRSIR